MESHRTYAAGDAANQCNTTLMQPKECTKTEPNPLVVFLSHFGQPRYLVRHVTTHAQLTSPPARDPQLAVAPDLSFDSYAEACEYQEQQARHGVYTLRFEATGVMKPSSDHIT